MNWILLAQIAYSILVVLVILRVLYDTRSSTKALAYILFIVFVPVAGMIFYFSFGINYRKRKLYSKKVDVDEPLRIQIRNKMNASSEAIRDSGLITEKHKTLTEFIRRSGSSPLTANNSVELFINGEEKFPALLIALENAKSHIHVEYYIYENDVTGNQIADVLIKKSKEGLEVRFMYDDFANRINYRNHRKIIIIDGTTSFVGGINMSDKYRNDLETKNTLFWRDTHLMIKGQATSYLQYLFLCDWNFCCAKKLTYNETYFPTIDQNEKIENDVVQIAASGPDSSQPVIFYSLLEAISCAKKSIYITSPYFIPGESLMDALIIAIQSGLDIKLLIPGISDSKMVNTAASAYYTELLQYGAKIYKYNKGFVHAKTMVIDADLAIIGSANMDYRSFDLNFEVNALVYSEKTAKELTIAFENDLKDSAQIDAKVWLNRPKYIHVWEKIVRLISPFL